MSTTEVQACLPQSMDSRSWWNCPAMLITIFFFMVLNKFRKSYEIQSLKSFEFYILWWRTRRQCCTYFSVGNLSPNIHFFPGWYFVSPVITNILCWHCAGNPSTTTSMSEQWLILTAVFLKLERAE